MVLICNTILVITLAALTKNEMVLNTSQKKLIQDQSEQITKLNASLQAQSDQIMAEPHFTPINLNEPVTPCTFISGPRGQVSCQ